MTASTKIISCAARYKKWKIVLREKMPVRDGYLLSVTNCIDSGLGQSWKVDPGGWQDDTSHDSSSHHGQNSSRFLKLWLKNKLIFQTSYYTPHCQNDCLSHCDPVNENCLNYPKKWIILYPPWHPHYVQSQCPVTIMEEAGQWCQPWPHPDMAIRFSFLMNSSWAQ